MQVGRTERILARRITRLYRRLQRILDALLQLLRSTVLLDAHAHELRVARVGGVVAPTLAHLFAVPALVLVDEALLESLEFFLVFHTG